MVIAKANEIDLVSLLKVGRYYPLLNADDTTPLPK